MLPLLSRGEPVDPPYTWISWLTLFLAMWDEPVDPPYTCSVLLFLITRVIVLVTPHTPTLPHMPPHSPQYATCPPKSTLPTCRPPHTVSQSENLAYVSNYKYNYKSDYKGRLWQGQNFGLKSVQGGPCWSGACRRGRTVILTVIVLLGLVLGSRFSVRIRVSVRD